MRILTAFISCCLLCLTATAQSRHDIVTKKILSIRMTFSANNVVIQNYYSRNGDDSLQFYNGRLQYIFKPTAIEEGRVMQIKRFDTKGREYEALTYTYDGDTAYSIEIAEARTGAILNKTRYDANHRTLYRIDKQTDTTRFFYSPSGKLSRIVKKVKGKESVDFVADPVGNENEWLARFITVPSMEISYSYNKSSGLMSEITIPLPDRKNTIYYSYEFYQ